MSAVTSEDGTSLLKTGCSTFASAKSPKMTRPPFCACPAEAPGLVPGAGLLHAPMMSDAMAKTTPSRTSDLTWNDRISCPTLLPPAPSRALFDSTYRPAPPADQSSRRDRRVGVPRDRASRDVEVR